MPNDATCFQARLETSDTHCSEVFDLPFGKGFIVTEEIQRSKFPEFLFYLGVLVAIWGFLTFPALLIAALFGLEAGIIAAVIAPLLIMAFLCMKIRSRNETIAEYFTSHYSPDFDYQGTFACLVVGTSFMGVSIFPWKTYLHCPENMTQADLVELPFLGVAVFLIGSGAVLIGISNLLGKLLSRKMLQEIDDRILRQPDKPVAYLERAALFLKKNKNKHALESLTRAIEVDPQYAEAYVRRGEFYYMQDGFDDAIADLSHAIELDPKNSEAYVLRSLVYEEMGENNLAEMDQLAADKLEQ